MMMWHVVAWGCDTLDWCKFFCYLLLHICILLKVWYLQLQTTGDQTMILGVPLESVSKTEEKEL